MNDSVVSFPRSILFVDGDVCVRESLAEWFRSAGWSVKTATCGREALNVAAASPPHYLVVEQALPDGSSFQLFERLRKLNASLTAVVLTRMASVAAAVEAIRMGFLDYVSKPIDAPRLVDHLVPRELEELDGAAGSNEHLAHDGALPSLAQLEWEHIHLVLRECGGNVTRAARVLGLPRRSLQRKLRRNMPLATADALGSGT